MKLLRPASVVETFSQLGFPPDRAIGIEFSNSLRDRLCDSASLCFRRDSADRLSWRCHRHHVRVESPLFTHTLFPVYVAALIWVGLLLRRPWLGTMLLQTRKYRAYPEKSGRRQNGVRSVA